MAVPGSGNALLCSIRSCCFALPLIHVLEIMRPLPVQPVRGSPAFVRGLAVVRGEAVPVVDLACLLDGERGSDGRWVRVRAGERVVMLSVDGITGIRALPDGVLRDLPPLLGNADSPLLAAAGALDSALMLVLDQGRLLPADMAESSGEAVRAEATA